MNFVGMPQKSIRQLLERNEFFVIHESSEKFKGRFASLQLGEMGLILIFYFIILAFE